MIEGQELGYAQRHGHEVRAGQPERTEHAHRVAHQVAHRVPGRAQRVGHGAARVAQVAADDEARTGRQPRAERLVPREHRVAGAVEEDDDRGGGIAEGLDAEVDPVGPDDPLACSARLRDALNPRRPPAAAPPDA
jgi:hypothetical protein